MIVFKDGLVPWTRLNSTYCSIFRFLAIVWPCQELEGMSHPTIISNNVIMKDGLIPWTQLNSTCCSLLFGLVRNLMACLTQLNQ